MSNFALSYKRYLRLHFFFCSAKKFFQEIQKKCTLHRTKVQALLDSSKDRNPPERVIILAKNVSFESYLKFCGTEQNLLVKIRLFNQEIITYEVPLVGAIN